MSDYLLYAYSINPLSFLMMSEKRGALQLDNTQLEEAYQSAWNSIKVMQ